MQLKTKKLVLTAVWQDCEFCSKFTFISRKKFYLSRKTSITNIDTSASRDALPLIILETAEKMLLLIISNDSIK